MRAETTESAERPGTRVARGAVTAPDGLLLVDKPAGVTSHDVVAMTRRMAATRKVGHAGTLDPMATGLLLLGVGRATRLLTHLVGADKTYRATVRLGQETLTEDAEGEVTGRRGCPPPGEHGVVEGLDEALAGLTGPIMQVPSAVSAIKVDGVRSYARVRGGQDVRLEPRAVVVHRLSAIGAPRPVVAADGTGVVDLDLLVECGSGTYVRALARDLGRALGCGAHLTALRRTAVGPFGVEEALSPQALSLAVEAGARQDPPRGLVTIPPAEIARACLPSVELSREQARAVGFGQQLDGDILSRRLPPRRGPLSTPPAPDDGGPVSPVAALAPDGGLVALLAPHHGRARPVLVLAPSTGAR